MTWASQAQLGEVLQAAFQAGDDLRNEWQEWMAGALTPWRWAVTAAQLADRSFDALRFVSPGSDGGLARQELRNKLEVYRLVKGARRLLGHPPTGVPFLLETFVEKAYELDAYRALWVVEGLGHDYAETALVRAEWPRALLCGQATEGLPKNSLAMLHGGLGLAFAEHALGTLSPRSSPAETRRALERFLRLCRESSMERYFDSAIEALGLETRCFFPDLVPVVECEVKALEDPELHRFFWHGVGRALYFLPVNFIPGYGSLWHALGMAERESPHEMAYENSLAGVSYAFTMVNMSHPGILEALLRDHGEELCDSAFADGVVASVLMRHEITPESRVLREFVDHRPGARVAELWHRIVRDPCRRGLGWDGKDQDVEVAEVYRSLPRG